jgi:hypothetical protein
MKRFAWVWAAALAAAAGAGCVERRYLVTSDPPGALVYRNGAPIGSTPVDDYFIYYGTYEFTLVKDGYETLQVKQKIDPPWYQVPPLDFFAENIWPFQIRDVREFNYKLQPMRMVPPETVFGRAKELRSQGQTLTPFNPENVPAPRTGPPRTGPGPVAPQDGAVTAPPSRPAP